MKKFFAIRLNPPRPSFSQDMSAEERAIMQKHIDYWREWMARGSVLAFGPVMDPKGAYGFGIVKVDDDSEIIGFVAGDPANGLVEFEYYPMLAVTPGP
jgi:uncharacterized protein